MSRALPPEGLRLNGAYLAWHFLVRPEQRPIEDTLDDAYGPATEPEAG